MNFIEQLQRISAKIFQESIKNYKFKDIIKHKQAKPHSLTEYLSLYPNKGVGFHIQRRSWSSNKHVRITAAEYKSNRFGLLRGIEYVDNNKQWDMPKKINGTSKRGIWTYNVGDATDFQTDNGVIYTTKDFQAYMQLRKRIDPPPLTEAEAEAVEQAVAEEGEEAGTQSAGQQQK